MIHILHQTRDPSLGTVDFFVDVKAPDLDFNDDQHAFIFTANKAKLRVAVVSRQFGGMTLFSYAPDQERDLMLSGVRALLSALGHAAPVNVTEGGSQWDRL